MKKKLLSLMMATFMVAMLLTGCGQKETSGDDVKASVEESREESKEESKEETKEVVEESKEVVESTEEVEESTEEAESEEVVESTEEEEETEVVVDSDIAKMYEGYFERENTIPENVKITASTEQMGMTMDMTMAHTADMDMVAYSLAEANMNMYISKEKVYCRYEIQGQETWIWAPITNDLEAAQFESMMDDSLVEPDYITACAYRESIEEDGVVYDLLDLSIDDGFSTGTATYFVNRETQKVEKCVMEQDGSTVVCLIEEIDSIEVPEASKNATEGTVEDVAGVMMAVILAGSGMTTE